MVIYSNFALIIAASLALASPAFAQQATDAAKTAPATQSAAKADATTSASDDAEVAATAALIAKANAAAAAGRSTDKPSDDAAFTKKAKSFGWFTEDRHGVTVYCQEAPVIGSRFTKKSCAKQSQLELILEQQEFERDQLLQRGCGGNCGGK